MEISEIRIRRQRNHNQNYDIAIQIVEITMEGQQFKEAVAKQYWEQHTIHLVQVNSGIYDRTSNCLCATTRSKSMLIFNGELIKTAEWQHNQ